MALGYFHDVCHPTLQDAQNAHFASVQPFMWASGANDIYHDFTFQAGAWKLYQYTVSSTGVFTLNHSTAIPLPNFPTCTLDATPAEMFADGMALGWGLVAACVAAGAIIFLRNAFK